MLTLILSYYAHKLTQQSTLEILEVIIITCTDGNSIIAGPAFQFPEGVVAGVAFQGFGEAQNIGYIVPTNVIRHFLEDVETHRRYTGFVSLGVTYQTLENSALKKFFGLENLKSSELPTGISPNGILIVQVDNVRNNQFKDECLKNESTPDSTTTPNSTTPDPANSEVKDSSSDHNDIYGLKKNDVLLALDGIDVSDDGTIHFR